MLLIKRYEEFNFQTGTRDAKKADWNNKKTASYFSFYKSLCDPWNPCAEAELTWFAYMMTYKARSKSAQEKDKENQMQLHANITCKLSPQFEAYLKAESQYALDQMDLVDSQRAKKAGVQLPQPDEQTPTKK